MTDTLDTVRTVLIETLELTQAPEDLGAIPPCSARSPSWTPSGWSSWSPRSRSGSTSRSTTTSSGRSSSRPSGTLADSSMPSRGLRRSRMGCAVPPRLPGFLAAVVACPTPVRRGDHGAAAVCGSRRGGCRSTPARRGRSRRSRAPRAGRSARRRSRRSCARTRPCSPDCCRRSRPCAPTTRV